MRSFTWRDGERLIRYGRGCASEVPALADAHGLAGYVLLTTPRALASVPAASVAAAEVVDVPHGQVPPIAAALRERCEGRPLIALGGGRVIDVAKAIAAVEGVRCGAVPTTLAGAELTPFHRLPEGASADPVRPALVVTDPLLLRGAPDDLLAGSAGNALGHALEPLYVPLRNPACEWASLRATALISRGATGSRTRLHDLALGGLFAAWALGQTGYAVHHVLAQSVVRAADASHGAINSILLPHTLDLMAPRAPSEVARFRRALRRDVREITSLVGPTRLRAAGVRRDALEGAADAAAGRSELQRTPRTPSRDDLLATLVRAW